MTSRRGQSHTIRREYYYAFLSIVLGSVFLLLALYYLPQRPEPLSTPPNGNLPPTPPTSLENAQSMHTTASYSVPRNVNTWVTLIVNEAHEDWPGEQNKFVSGTNSQLLPQHLVLYSGQAVAFHNSDAPWDSHHSHVVTIKSNGTGSTAWTSESLGYPFFNQGPSMSQSVVLSPGEYTVTMNTNGISFPIKAATIKVLNETISAGASLISGAFYTPQNIVSNPTDNTGVSHPGHLAYYQLHFTTRNWTIASIHDFTHAPHNGSYWPDNKTIQHALIIWRTQKSLSEVMSDLDTFTKDNVYI